jgi:hypothetical protein
MVVHGGRYGQLAATIADAAKDNFKTVQFGKQLFCLPPVFAAQSLHKPLDALFHGLSGLLRHAIALRGFGCRFKFFGHFGNFRIGFLSFFRLALMQRKPIFAATNGIPQRVVGCFKSLKLFGGMAAFPHAAQGKTDGIQRTLHSGILAVQKIKGNIDAPLKAKPCEIIDISNGLYRAAMMAKQGPQGHGPLAEPTMAIAM